MRRNLWKIRLVYFTILQWPDAAAYNSLKASIAIPLFWQPAIQGLWAMLEPSIYSPLVALPVMNVSNSLLDTWVLGDSPTSCLQAMFIIHEKVLWNWSSVIVAWPWLWFCFHQFISSWFYLSPPSHLSVVSLPSWDLFVWKPFHAYDHCLCPQWYLEFFKTLTWSGNTEVKVASIKTEVSHGPLISSKYWSLIWWGICLGSCKFTFVQNRSSHFD